MKLIAFKDFIIVIKLDNYSRYVEHFHSSGLPEESMLAIMYMYVLTLEERSVLMCTSVCFFQVPGINLVGNIIWFPNEFLMQKLPPMAKTLDRKALNTVAQGRLNWLTQKNTTLNRHVAVVLLDCKA